MLPTDMLHVHSGYVSVISYFDSYFTLATGNKFDTVTIAMVAIATKVKSVIKHSVTVTLSSTAAPPTFSALPAIRS